MAPPYDKLPSPFLAGPDAPASVRARCARAGPVNAIAGRLQVSRPAVSQHLKALRAGWSGKQPKATPDLLAAPRKA